MSSTKAPTVNRLAGCSLLLAVLICLPFVQPSSESLPQIAKWLGRFHVVLLHFPVGLLAIALVLELASLAWLQRWLPATPAPVTAFILALGAGSAFAAAVCGWLLSLQGGYEAVLLQRHFYLGLAAAIGALLALAAKLAGNLRPTSRLLRRATLPLLIGTNLAVLGAGHFGGSITHGEDYLTEHAPDVVRQLLGQSGGKPTGRASGPVEEREVYQGAIQPILSQFCVSCHGAQKAKGDLRLDRWEYALKGGDGKVVVPSQPEASELLKRLRLPLEDDDHMPPSGKPQLPPELVAVLHWWIETGAKETAKVRELNPPPAVLAAMRQHGGVASSKE